MKKVGLIINPIAGMGGAVGLKGTDGMAKEALHLGAVPSSGKKAIRALSVFQNELKGGGPMLLLAAPGSMGEEAAVSSGLLPDVIDMKLPEMTTSNDTVRAVGKMLGAGADLILFAGGDGTARDICSVLKDNIPVIGIPGGVKIHSPVFARTPEKAGELAALYMTGRAKQVLEKEVLDIDESAYRKGRVITRLFGYLSVPFEKHKMQSRKAPSPVFEQASQSRIASEIIHRMHKDVVYLIGPGTTCRPVLEQLGLESSLLGVDVVCNKNLQIKDASEKQIAKAVENRNFKIVVTPIGGQGYLFGRGNHQISAKIIQMAGKENIIVAATPEKIAGLKGEPFQIDSGNPNLDQALSGYIRVITGHKSEMMYKIV